MKQYIPKLTVKRWWIQDCALFLIAPSVVAIAAALNAMGLFQAFEWSVYDAFFKLRPLEQKDSRIVVVTIDDDDLASVKRASISDELLATLLLRLQQEQATVIGLDMYRDLAVGSGQEKLTEVFQSMSNVIGIRKISGSWVVQAPAILQEKNQVATVDIVEDTDLKVRRGLISVKHDDHIHLTLGPRVALEYLEEKGIFLERGENEHEIRLGKATFSPLNSNDGGYVKADTDGYQILLNYRGQEENFQTVSLRHVLSGEITENFFRDRIVFVGITARSVYDFFSTPYSRTDFFDKTRMPGVFIHANLASQIVSGAVDGRPFLRTIPETQEWLWALGWSLVSVFLSGHLLKHGRFFGVLVSYGGLMLMISVMIVCTVGCSYLAFLNSLWIPVIPTAASTIFSGLAMIGIYGQRLHQLAYRDGLTRVANRRYFDQILTQRIQFQGYLSIILCDVDHFKLYNDTYGHLAGDVCLQKVANAIKSAVRRSDSVARYGGEEFVIMLPATDQKSAFRIAERVVEQVRSLQIPHSSSKTAENVTLSCGVTTVLINEVLLQRSEWNAEAIIANADQGLYEAKEKGRDRAISQNFSLPLRSP
ncbi:MAG: CHASE2 domain-containing protein [Cyanobacteria bacterium P01_F01_bin.150]